MKNKIGLRAIAICMWISAYGFSWQPVVAAQFEFCPRLETGILDYTIEYDALGKTTLSVPRQATGYNNTREKSEINDHLSFVGGGATFFVNRVFIDLYGQYAFEGKGRAQLSTSIFNEKEDDTTWFASQDYNRITRFDHKDYAITLGYAINKELSVFAGYKWAAADIHDSIDGVIYTYYPAISGLSINDHHTERNVDFKYEGPFIGAIHGWKMDTRYFLKGAISAKIGLAYLNSKYIANTLTTFIDQYDNSIEYDKYTEESKGDTWGFSLGIGWLGLTPIRNLSYSLDVSAYRYSFDSNNAILGTLNESVISYKAGLSYAF